MRLGARGKGRIRLGARSPDDAGLITVLLQGLRDRVAAALHVDATLTLTARLRAALGEVGATLGLTARANQALQADPVLPMQARAVAAVGSVDPTVQVQARLSAALASADPVLAAAARAAVALAAADPSLLATARATQALAIDVGPLAVLARAGLQVQPEPTLGAQARALAALASVDPVLTITARAAQAVASVDPTLPVTARATQALNVDVGPLAATARAAAEFGVGLEVQHRGALGLAEVHPTLLQTAKGAMVLLADPVLQASARSALAVEPAPILVAGKYGKARQRPGNVLRVTIEDLLASKDSWVTATAGCLEDLNHNDDQVRGRTKDNILPREGIIGWDLTGLKPPTGATMRCTRAVLSYNIASWPAAPTMLTPATFNWQIGDADDWGETLVKCSNRPGFSALAASESYNSGVTGQRTVTLDEDFRARVEARVGVGIITLMLDMPAATASREVEIDDRESGAGVGPRLTLDLEWYHYATATFDPTKDCAVEIQVDCGADVNLNGSDLQVTDGDELDRYTYIAFTLSGLPADPIIDRAQLRLHFLAGAGAAQTVGISAIAEADKDWTEIGIKCSDHPASTISLGICTFPTASGQQFIDLPQETLDYLRDRAGDTDVTLLLTIGAGQDRVFGRRERATASERPQLKVWYYG